MVSASLVPTGTELVGRVIHYYNAISVAIVKLDRGRVSVGDTLYLRGHTTDIKLQVESMEVEHQKIDRAAVGDEFGLKVAGHVREHDLVYRVTQP